MWKADAPHRPPPSKLSSYLPALVSRRLCEPQYRAISATWSAVRIWPKCKVAGRQEGTFA